MGATQSSTLQPPLLLALQALAEILASLDEWRATHAQPTQKGASVRVAFNILSSQVPFGTGRVGVAYFPFSKGLKAFYVAPGSNALTELPILELAPQTFTRNPGFARSFKLFTSSSRAPLKVVFDVSVEDREVQGERGPCNLPDKNYIERQCYQPRGAQQRVVFRREPGCEDDCCFWKSAPVEFAPSSRV